MAMGNEGGGGQANLVDGVPAVAGIRDLFIQLDTLAKCRPPGDPPLPPVLLQGDLADSTVSGYRRRLRDHAGNVTVPNVLVPSADPADDPGFFDGIVTGLKQDMPDGRRGMAGVRGLRLPLYRRVRDALDAGPSDDPDADPRQHLRNQLHDRRSKLVSWAKPLNDAAGQADRNRLLHLLGLVGLLAVPVSRVLFGWRLRFGRFRWFSKNVEKIDGRYLDFLDYALHLTNVGDLRNDNALIRQVLMLALLGDLQGATRLSLMSPSRRRRVTPFVVHLEHVVQGSPGYRLIETLIRVEPTALKRHTLMVLASLAPDATGDGAPGRASGPSSLRAAAEELGPLTEQGAALPADRLLVVDVPPDPTSEDDQLWLERNRRVIPQPRRVWLVPLAMVLGGLSSIPSILVILVLLGVMSWPGAKPRCPHLNDVGSETIGLGDGTAECSVFDDVSDAQRPLAAAMKHVEMAIAEENTEVLDRGQPYGTIVFFAPLTVPDDESERQDENALNQLRGIYLAQLRANEAAAADQNRAFTRVLIANAGDQFTHGEDVAHRIIDEASEDEKIIGVIGISQSRDVSFEAVRELGGAGLPVVAGPVTGDQMVSTTNRYFQVSPRNARVAAMLVEFSENTAIVPVGEDELTVPDGAVITTDHSDAYSQNLAEDLYRELDDSDVDIVSYPFANSGARPEPSADVPPPIPASSLNELASQVCNAMEPGDVIYFTNRSSQFEGLLNAMEDNNDCPGAFTVLGGSAVTKLLENEPDLMAKHPGVNLYYAAFSSRDLAYNSSTERFIESYDETYGADTGSDPGVGTDVSDAALTYDAFEALQRTANYAKQNDFTISAPPSAQALIDEQIEFDGTSGYIAFGNDPLRSEDGGYKQVPPEKPVLVLRAGKTGSPPELACGRFSDDHKQDTWGPDRRPCPTAN